MIILKNIPLYALRDFIQHCNEQIVEKYSWN